MQTTATRLILGARRVAVNAARRPLSQFIVRSPAECEIHDLGGKQPPLPKYLMENFMKDSWKGLDAVVDGHTGRVETYEDLYQVRTLYFVCHSLSRSATLTY